MRAWSWMAALALIAGTSIAVGRAMPASSPTRPDDTQGQTRATEPLRTGPAGTSPEMKRSASTIPAIRLNLEIAGLGQRGCEVEVKPGNPSCRFRTFKLSTENARGTRGSEGALHVTSEGHATLELKDVELRGADRMCTVAITVREAGHNPKTVYRGFRIPARPEANAGSPVSADLIFTCYLSSASKTATASTATTAASDRSSPTRK